MFRCLSETITKKTTVMISIIIPTYNGSHILEKELPLLKKYLIGTCLEFEIVVVDEGSDRNVELTERIVLANSAIYIRCDQNLGKGSAVRLGMNRAIGEFCFYTDVDVPFEYSAFEDFMNYFGQEDPDLVIGDRSLPESSYFKEVSFARKWGSAIFKSFSRALLSRELCDTQCGFKGFKRSVVKDLFSLARINGFAFDVELLFIAIKHNYIIKRRPVILRNVETSSVSLIKHGPRMIWDLLRIRLNNMMNRYK